MKIGLNELRKIVNYATLTALNENKNILNEGPRPKKNGRDVNVHSDIRNIARDKGLNIRKEYIDRDGNVKEVKFKGGNYVPVVDGKVSLLLGHDGKTYAEIFELGSSTFSDMIQVSKVGGRYTFSERIEDSEILNNTNGIPDGFYVLRSTGDVLYGGHSGFNGKFTGFTKQSGNKANIVIRAMRNKRSNKTSGENTRRYGDSYYDEKGMGNHTPETSATPNAEYANRMGNNGENKNANEKSVENSSHENPLEIKTINGFLKTSNKVDMDFQVRNFRATTKIGEEFNNGEAFIIGALEHGSNVKDFPSGVVKIIDCDVKKIAESEPGVDGIQNVVFHITRDGVETELTVSEVLDNSRTGYHYEYNKGGKKYAWSMDGIKEINPGGVKPEEDVNLGGERDGELESGLEPEPSVVGASGADNKLTVYNTEGKPVDSFTFTKDGKLFFKGKQVAITKLGAAKTDTDTPRGLYKSAIKTDMPTDSREAGIITIEYNGRHESYLLTYDVKTKTESFTGADGLEHNKNVREPFNPRIESINESIVNYCKNIPEEVAAIKKSILLNSEGDLAGIDGKKITIDKPINVRVEALKTEFRDYMRRVKDSPKGFLNTAVSAVKNLAYSIGRLYPAKAQRIKNVTYRSEKAIKEVNKNAQNKNFNDDNKAREQFIRIEQQVLDATIEDCFRSLNVEGKESRLLRYCTWRDAVARGVVTIVCMKIIYSLVCKEDEELKNVSKMVQAAGNVTNDEAQKGVNNNLETVLKEANDNSSNQEVPEYGFIDKLGNYADNIVDDVDNLKTRLLACLNDKIGVLNKEVIEETKEIAIRGLSEQVGDSIVKPGPQMSPIVRGGDSIPQSDVQKNKRSDIPEDVKVVITDGVEILCSTVVTDDTNKDEVSTDEAINTVTTSVVIGEYFGGIGNAEPSKSVENTELNSNAFESKSTIKKIVNEDINRIKENFNRLVSY